MYKFMKVKEIAPTNPKAPDRMLVAQKANGDIYEKKFYSNNKNLVRQLAEFGTGDWIEITFDETRFKNIVDVKAGQPVDPPKERPNAGDSSTPVGRNAVGFSARRSDGTSRGDDTNRSAALYFVKDLVTAWFEGQTAADKKKVGIKDMVAMSIDHAQVVYDYIANGNAAPSDVGVGGDPLEPPALDD